MVVKELLNREEKSKICRRIPHALSQWFAYEEPIEDYQDRHRIGRFMDL